MNVLLAWWPFLAAGAFVLVGMGLCERTVAGRRLLDHLGRVLFGGTS